MHAWAGAWICSAFRNEGAVLSSILIAEAIAATRWMGANTLGWGPEPEMGCITFVDSRKVKPRRGRAPWGWCYQKAGWTLLDERTKKRRFYVLQQLPEEMPDPAVPIGATLALFA